MRVDDSRIRKEKVADSKISGYVWTGSERAAHRPTCSSLKTTLSLAWNSSEFGSTKPYAKFKINAVTIICISHEQYGAWPFQNNSTVNSRGNFYCISRPWSWTYNRKDDQCVSCGQLTSNWTSYQFVLVNLKRNAELLISMICKLNWPAPTPHQIKR